MRRVTVLAVLVVGLLLTACTSQEPAVVTEEQVPTPVAEAARAAAGGASPGAGAGPVAATVEFTAVEFAFEGLPSSTSGGTVEFVMSNEGAVQHNMHIEELGGQEIIPTIGGGSQESGTAPLESGESVTLFCSVPGHRAQGMEASLQVQ